MIAKVISFKQAKDPVIEAKKGDKLKAMQAAFKAARKEAGVDLEPRKKTSKKARKKGKPKSKR